MKSVLMGSVLALLVVKVLLEVLRVSCANAFRCDERVRTISRIAFAEKQVLSDSLTTRKGSFLRHWPGSLFRIYEVVRYVFTAVESGSVTSS